MSPAPTPIRRDTARVLVVDEDDRLLLFSYAGQPTRWWTVGGGVGPGETYEEAALRELREETGLVGVDLSAEVWRGRPWIAHWGDAVYEVHQRYFVVKVPRCDIDTLGFEDFERSTVSGHRWWTSKELAATSDILRPAGLPQLFGQLLAHGLPVEPIIVDG